MKALLFFLFAASLVVTGCRTSKNSNDSVISIMHGTSFGHCVGYCIREEIHSKDLLTYIKRSNQEAQYPETETQIMESLGENGPINQTRFDKLLKSFKLSDFILLPERIGCPDCADGGAEYIEIKTANSVKRVTFEYGKAPEGMKELLDILRANREPVE